MFQLHSFIYLDGGKHTNKHIRRTKQIFNGSSVVELRKSANDKKL